MTGEPQSLLVRIRRALGFDRIYADVDRIEIELAEAREAAANRLTARELATVLAALRYWQREGFFSCGHELDVASVGDSVDPLTSGEIDALCDRLNDGIAATVLAASSREDIPA